MNSLNFSEIAFFFFALSLKKEEGEVRGGGRGGFVVIHKWNKLYYHHPESCSSFSCSK